MTIHDRHGLTKVINARGTFTPLGVSRSSARVGRAVAEALQGYVVIDELQELASRKIADFAGSEAGAVTHCTAAGITLSIAATMTGTSQDRIAALPDTKGMPDRVVLPANHAVDYGHPILQAVRLAGATPVLAGSVDACSIIDLESELDHADSCCLLLVSSRLTTGRPVDLASAVDASHRRGIPAILDGAAQDMRIGELTATGADLILVSAQKYLASPTAGLVIGRRGSRGRRSCPRTRYRARDEGDQGSDRRRSRRSRGACRAGRRRVARARWPAKLIGLHRPRQRPARHQRMAGRRPRRHAVFARPSPGERPASLASMPHRWSRP